ncbi:MAG TPA: hypothetical protein EYH49_05485 [Aquifex aeolicus]|nr:hypothetical protein [Aquifex aeolicus]
MGLSHKVIVSFALSGLLISCAPKTATERDSGEREAVPTPRPLVVPEPPPPVPMPTYSEISPFEGKSFTLSAVEAPLTKVLYAIADDAELNLVISPEVDRNITITATFRDTPLQEALEIIMDMTGLYYELRGNVLYVREIMTKTFKLPYVHTVTQYTSSLGGDVLGGALLGGGTLGTAAVGGFGAGTSGLRGNFALDYRNPENVSDFYAQIEENLKGLLSDKGEYVLNRFTGTLVVTDRRRNVEKVEEFLRKVKFQASKQVLIEAKIVEISLRDEFSYGIDWNAFFRNFLGSGTGVTLSQTLALPTGGFASLGVVSGDMSALLDALARYGKVHTLSNPRIMVVNGQTALIATGIVTPFFERQALTIVPGTAPAQVQESIVRTTVLEGILLGVTPTIDDEGEIILNIIPVSTRLEGSKTFEREGEVIAEAPILNIKESGTIVRVRDNDLIVIGGLIGDVSVVEERKVPGLGDIPLIGYLFKSKRVLKEKRELIIFLRPRIIHPEP